MKHVILLLISFITIPTLKAQETVKIKITVGAKSFIATTNDNASAKAFIGMLPMTVSMNELNGNEKYYYMSDNLPVATERPSTIHNGDLMLYQQNCIVIFYETFSSSFNYTKIGYIDNPTGLKTALGSGNPIVIFEVVKGTTAIDELKETSIEYTLTNEGILHYLGTAKRITLLDINGRILTNTTSHVLNMNNFSRGIYLLKIESKEQNQTSIIKLKY